MCSWQQKGGVWKCWGFVTDFSDTPWVTGYLLSCHPTSKGATCTTQRTEPSTNSPACMGRCECHLHFPALKHHRCTINPQRIQREALDAEQIMGKMRKDADKGGWEKNNSKKLFVLLRKVCGPPYSNVLHAQEAL